MSRKQKQADETKQRGRGIRRLHVGAHALLQGVLVLVIFVMLNVFSFDNFRRWDVSGTGDNALAPVTRDFLNSIEKPVRMIAIFQPGHPLARHVGRVLTEFQHASGRKVTFENVDPYRDFARTAELQRKYAFGREESLVILDTGVRHKFVRTPQMAEIEPGDGMFTKPTVLSVFAEQALTGALIELIEGKPNKLYFLTGQGEVEPGPGTKLSQFQTYLAQQNTHLVPLNLVESPVIPEDAKALMILGPITDFTEKEIATLEAYWERSGRLLICLAEGTLTPRLDAFVATRGIKPREDRVLSVSDIGLGSVGVVGLVQDVVATASGNHPAVRGLAGINLEFRGLTKSLELETQPPKDLTLAPLLNALDSFWGETRTTEVRAGIVPRFDPGEDTDKPVVIAAAAERGGVGDERLSVNSARLVVIGNADALFDQTLTPGSLDFTTSALNWLLDRAQLTGVAAKRPRQFSANLTEEQVRKLLLNAILVPALIAFAGMMVSWSRRR